MQTPQYGVLDSRNLIGIWDQMYEPALNGVWATQIGNIVSSDRETETYGWLGSSPTLQVMTADNPTEEQLKVYSYALRNIEYAVALKIAEKDMRRDKIGQLKLRIGEMSQKAAENWNTLTAKAIIANGNGYDGTTFFSTTHNESGTAQINDLSVTQVPALNVADTGNVPTPAEAAAAINGVIGNFYNLTDDRGDPINGQAKDFTILVGNTNNWAPINYAVNAMTFAGGQSNQLQGLAVNNGIKIRVELTPLLSSFTNGFYIFRNDGAVKSLILQNEVDIDLQTTTTDNDEYKKYRRFLFSLYTSRAAGYGRWQSAARATFS